MLFWRFFSNLFITWLQGIFLCILQCKSFHFFCYTFWHWSRLKSFFNSTPSILLHLCLVTKCLNSMPSALSVHGSAIPCSIILFLYIYARLFKVIARPALSSIFNPSIISARMTSFRELSGISVLQSIFNIMIWPFRSSTFFSCSNW